MHRPTWVLCMYMKYSFQPSICIQVLSLSSLCLRPHVFLLLGFLSSLDGMDFAYLMVLCFVEGGSYLFETPVLC